LQGGDRHLAALLQVSAALMAIVSIPLLTDVFRAAYRIEGWDIGPKAVALQVGMVQVLPLMVGLVLRRRFPLIASRWAQPIQKVAFLVNLVALGLILFKVSPKLLTFFQDNLTAIPVMGLMTAIALAVGYLLGGQGPGERTTTALVTSMRNPGLALLFAITYGKEILGVKLAIVTYLLVRILCSMPFLRWSRRTDP
ncbi:MAG: transporter, partial [Cyanobium sp.]